MRKTLVAEFDEIYVLDLGGNVRKNPKLSGTTHNVFGIQVGVSVNLLVRTKGDREKRSCWLYYARMHETWTKEQKLEYLESVRDKGGIEWRQLHPDNKGNWLTGGIQQDFDTLIPLGIVSRNSAKSPARALFSFSATEMTRAATLGCTTSIEKW